MKQKNLFQNIVEGEATSFIPSLFCPIKLVKTCYQHVSSHSNRNWTVSENRKNNRLQQSLDSLFATFSFIGLLSINKKLKKEEYRKCNSTNKYIHPSWIWLGEACFCFLSLFPPKEFLNKGKVSITVGWAFSKSR